MKCTNWWPWKRCSAPAQKGSGRGLGLGPGSRAPKAARRAEAVGLGPKARRSPPRVDAPGRHRREEQVGSPLAFTTESEKNAQSIILPKCSQAKFKVDSPVIDYTMVKGQLLEHK